MLRPHSTSAGQRRGTILIVTLLLLALFAVVGLTVVYYTKDLSERQRIMVDAQSNGTGLFPDDGTGAFNAFLGQVIYDSNGGTPIWGQSMMRTMYGGGQPGTSSPPWNGVGTFHETIQLTQAGSGAPPITLDRAQIVNMSTFSATSPFGQAVFINSSGNPFASFTPEISANFPVASAGPPKTLGGGAYVPKNAPYTYPDLNNFWLGTINPATGEVLVPSFYRSYLFNAQPLPNPLPSPLPSSWPPTGLETTNPNWVNLAGRYLVTRPRPVDQLSPAAITAAGLPFPLPASPNAAQQTAINNLLQQQWALGNIFPPVQPNTDGSVTGDVQNLPGGFLFNPLLNTNTPGLGQFIAKNDSTWQDIGMPVITLPNGKMVKPVVAPLIVPIDGLLNPNVHGNQLGSGSIHTSGAGMGPWEVSLERFFGTDGRAIVQARGLARTQAGGVTGTQKSYASRFVGGQLPAASAVAWTGAGGAAGGNLNLPGVGTNGFYSTVPTYSPTYATVPAYVPGYDSTNSAVANHPALFNPSEWPAIIGASPRSFPLSDLKQLNFRYAFTPSTYGFPQLDLGGQTLTSLRGSVAYPTAYPPYTAANPPVPALTTPSSYRTDGAHTNRMLFTTSNYSLDWPGLSPNYLNLTTGNALALVPGSILTGGVLMNPASGQQFPTPTTPAVGTFSDFPNQGQWTNSRAVLGPLDLNRTLADYRGNTGAPLSPTNMIGSPPYNVAPYNAPPYVATFGTQTVPQAIIDRQQLAMSIFVRLVVASGAQATYTTIPGIGETISLPTTMMQQLPGPPVAPNPAFNPSTPEYNALRALAQMAVNIVDYVDPDDVSTAFVWNPISTADPLNPANFISATAINNSVVFGVEKPRLVLTEAYAEVITDPNDTAFTNAMATAGNQPSLAPIRFWLEFQNPTNAPPYSTPGAGPLNDGSVQLQYTPAQLGVGALPTPIPSFSPYVVQIVRSSPGGVAGTSVLRYLRDPTYSDAVFGSSLANVTGSFGSVPPDLTFDFSTATPAQANVQPANGNPSGGIIVCAPAPLTATQNVEFTPTLPNAIVATAPVPGPGISTTSLTYTMPLATAFPQANAQNPAYAPSADLRNHVIVLRRLANPYLPGPSVTNPYVTIDSMDHVPATDRVLLPFGSKNANKRSAATAAGTAGYAAAPASLGKVQPYAGWVATPTTMAGLAIQYTGTYNFAFPSSLVLPQTAASTTTVLNTFGQVNSATPGTPPVGSTYTVGTGKLVNGGAKETIMTPFDWLVQFDRPLINQIELFHVSSGKPHELTMRFIVPNAMAPGVATDVQKFGYAAVGTINSATNNGLYRALDVLRVQPYGQMTGLAGRAPGRISLNAITDKRVWDSLFDAQAGNGFTPTDVTTMWSAMIATRTQNMQARVNASGKQLTDATGATYSTPIPGASVYDVFAGGPTSAGPIITGTNPVTGTGPDRPFLPFGAPTWAAAPTPLTPGSSFAYTNGSSLLTDTVVRNGSLVTLPNGGAHPYQQAEALRKITNNTTTVSHTFAVWVTVGYFEVTPTGTLGKEYYTMVPGDLRKKFFSVVDRSNVGLIPGGGGQSTTPPIFTTLESAVQPLPTPLPNPLPVVSLKIATSGSNVIFSNGTAVNLNNVSTLVLGSGATADTVSVTGYTDNGNGTSTVTYSAGTVQNPHWPGETVSNVVPGNPGPQPGFDVTQAPYTFVVPYWSRVP